MPFNDDRVIEENIGPPLEGRGNDDLHQARTEAFAAMEAARPAPSGRGGSDNDVSRRNDDDEEERRRIQILIQLGIIKPGGRR